MKQFSDVSSARGAPMGRRNAADLDTGPRRVRLFAVRLDSGGYDDGGAYWGIRRPGLRLWCARDADGAQRFADAASREAAALILGIPATALRVPLDRWHDYAFALLDGRAPMPAGVDRADVIAWMQESGAAMGQAPRAYRCTTSDGRTVQVNARNACDALKAAERETGFYCRNAQLVERAP